MIMSSYFNVQYLHQKMIRIYADIVQNHTQNQGCFQTFGGQCIFNCLIGDNLSISTKFYNLDNKGKINKYIKVNYVNFCY